MVKIIIHQKEWVLQLTLKNAKMFYLKRKLLDTKWKGFNVKNINKELMKLPKYLCYVLTIKDTC